MIRLADARVPEHAVEAVAAVLRSGQLLAAQECSEFEKELAALLGCGYVVTTSSGTAALHLALLGLDIGPGDAVLVPDFTFPATANAVVATGAVPVVVDVDPGSFTMSATDLERVITSWSGPARLSTVMPVQEFGRCAEMEEILSVADRHGLRVVEDAACALGSSIHGRPAGTWGQAGCFSFHPRKSLTTGEGGAISTDDGAYADRLRRLRNHGMERIDGQLVFTEVGLNYRLTDFQAALGRAQLPALGTMVERRRAVAEAYSAGLRGLLGRGVAQLPEDHPGHTWQTYMVVLEEGVDRARVIEAMRGAGVEANVGAQSLTAIGLYGPTSAEVGPVLDRCGLALPCHHGITNDETRTVVLSLYEALSR